MSTALSFLDAVQGYVEGGSRSSADRPIRLAVVDPAYNPWAGYPSPPPPARVTFEGETVLSGKAYPYASGFIPWAGTRVVMVPIGNSYLIAGALSPQTPQGFWQNAAGTESGVELGGGSYYDTDEGLVIAGDASISGDLDVDGIGAFLHKRRGSDGPSVVNSTTLVTDSVLFLDLSVGNWVLDFYGAYTSVAGDIATNWAFTGTWSGLKFTTGISPFAINTATVNDTPSRDSAAQRSSVHQLNTTVPYGANDASNYAGLHESASVNVTVAGRWSIQYAQRVAAAAQALMRNPSYMTARKV